MARAGRHGPGGLGTARPVVPAHKGLGHTSSSSSSRTHSPSFLFPLPPPPSPPLVDALRSLLQSPSLDAATIRDQAILSVTAIAVATIPSPLPPFDASHLESLAELLLAIANHPRPDHGPDRLSRALACKSLRELEHAHPLLLSDVVGHLWALAQAERTHATQSYLLLLAAVVRNIALHGLLSSPSSILSTSTPLVPFSTPQSLFSSSHLNREPSDLNLREILHPPRFRPCQARLKIYRGPCQAAKFFFRAMPGMA